MFRSSHFILVTFGDKVTKIQKNYVVFVHILQGKMGKMEKWKEHHATKVTKIPKTKRQKIWDERNISLSIHYKLPPEVLILYQVIVHLENVWTTYIIYHNNKYLT